MLVIGPNRVFLRYIEQVLPSLGEAGVEQVVLADLVPTSMSLARRPTRRSRRGSRATLRMSRRDRQGGHRPRAPAPRRPRRPVPHRLPAAAGRRDAAASCSAAQRRFRRHNAARRWVEGEVWSAMAATWRDGDLPAQRSATGCAHLARDPRGARADVAGAHAGPAAARPVRLEGAAALAADEVPRRGRVPVAPPAARPHDVRDVRWTEADVALLDEAREAARTAARRRTRQAGRGRRDPHLRPHRDRRGAGPHADAAADGGPPFAQRVDDGRRRHRPGDRHRSRPTSWDDVLAHLPDRKAVRVDRAERRLPHPGPDHGAGANR